MKIGGSKGVHYNFTQITHLLYFFMKCKDCAGIFVSDKYSVYVVDTILLNGIFVVCWIDWAVFFNK